MAVPLLIIAGQSNGEGLGDLANYPFYLKNTISGSHLYVKSGGDTSADDGAWTTLKPCVNTNTEVSFAGFSGAEISLAFRLQSLYGIFPWIVKACYSATTLGFKVGATNWDPTITGPYALYRQMMDWYVNRAARDIGQSYTPYFLWDQSETDAISGNDALAAAYQTNLTNFISHVRTDLSVPNMPFIIYKLRPDLEVGYTNQSIIIAAQNAVVASVPNTYLINSDANPYFLGLHYSSPGYVLRGVQAADLFMKIK